MQTFQEKCVGVLKRGPAEDDENTSGKPRVSGGPAGTHSFLTVIR